MSDCYPISLLIRDLPCLVLGGGAVAERKVLRLLDAGARVRAVAPEITKQLECLSADGIIEVIRREASMEDLDGMRLVIIATSDAETNEAIALEAQRRGLLVNVVDVPRLCNFYVPATVDRGPINVAVSTGGAAPALAKHLRRRLEEVVGEEYGRLAALMGELRPDVMQRWPTQQERAAAWENLLASDVLALLKQGREDEARQLALQVLGLL
jgi:uroporphyrin-III C-methyltransferase/precorrin-2 dehydrogenase/sirohydrochlorin ferrochelatase